MSFVITNNVHYYDLTLDITFSFASAEAIKCQLQSFSSSFGLHFFSFRLMAIISFSIAEEKKEKRWNFQRFATIVQTDGNDGRKKSSRLCRNSNAFALHFFFSAAQVSPLSIRSRLLIDKVCRRKVFAREGNGGINVMSL